MIKGRKFILYAVSVLLIVEAGVFGSLPFVRAGLLGALEQRFPKAAAWFGEPSSKYVPPFSVTVDENFPALWNNDDGMWNRDQKITRDFIAYANSSAPEGYAFSALIQHGNIVLVEWQANSVYGVRGPIITYLFLYTDRDGWRLMSSYCEAHCSSQ